MGKASLAACFPGRELEILRLRAQDTEFRGICDDYDSALTALRHWQGAERENARAEEYRQLAAELAAEIISNLDSRRASPPRTDDD
jgi:hypothetical protein